MIKNTVLQEKELIESWLSEIQKKLSNLPEGTLYCTRNGRYFKWFHLIDGKQKYIPKNRRDLAEQLAKKKYLIALQNDLKHEIYCLDLYLNNHIEDWKSQKYLIEDSSYHHLLSPFFQPLSKELELWSSQSYNSNPHYPEQLIHNTASGIKVRSKSEVLIDMVLFLHKIPYRYEAELIVGNKIYYPDFTIRHPKTGQFIYYEHFGKMDDYEYREYTMTKLQFYIENGIIPGVNLITTYETSKCPLTFERVQKIIELYLDSNTSR